MNISGVRSIWRRFSRVSACCLLLATSSAAAAMTDSSVDASDVASKKPCSNKPTQLIPSQKLVRELAGGECHNYQITLQKNQFLHVVADQQGIDVVLTLYSPEGAELLRVDRPSGSRGPETLSLIAPTAGLYLLNVRSWEDVSARGKYELTLSPPRLAESGDQIQIKAERLISDGESLLETTGSLRAAATKFQQAADTWYALGNTYEEALALYGAGYSCFSYGDNQLAIDYLKRALSIFLQLKDSYGEAMAKNALGWPYLYLSDLESASESFGRAYEIHRASNNPRGAGISVFGLGWVYAMKGDDGQALEKFSESLDWRRKALDRHGEALTLIGIAKVQSRLGRQEDALNNLNGALQLLPKSSPHDQADILSNF